MRRVIGLLVLLVSIVGTPASSLAAEDDGAAAGEKCGTVAGIGCATGLWCDLEGRCGATDLPGICVATGEICTAQSIPVCGCDGKTYDNDCKRRAAKVQKHHDGACKKG